MVRDGHVSNRTASVAMGVNMDGEGDILFTPTRPAPEHGNHPVGDIDLVADRVTNIRGDLGVAGIDSALHPGTVDGLFEVREICVRFA